MRRNGQRLTSSWVGIVMACCWTLMMCSLVWSTVWAETTAPATAPTQSPQASGAAVKFEGTTLFTIYDTLGAFSPQERAAAIEARLARLASDRLSPLDDIQINDVGNNTIITAGDNILMAVTDRDAAPLGQDRQAVAKDYAKRIQTALVGSREKHTLRSLFIDISLALLDTAILVALLVIFHKTFPRLYARIDAWRGTVIRSIKIQNVELLSAGQIAAGLIALAKGIHITALGFLLYLYISTVLGIFPWTRGISASLFGAILSTLMAIGRAFVIFIPNVAAIVVIIVVTRYILKLIALFFNGVSRGAVKFKGFHREWAEPTYRIVRFFVVVFAVIACFPQIPGSQSEGFRGISVFLGLLISLGSASAFGNIVSGVVLTYMRPFRIGDRVRIADATGDVMEKTLLVTRLRTIKNVDVTIPNAMVLGSHLINFSSCAREQGLILHTSVTIGYDAPWRTVHELLIAAARATPHILEKPEPFVMQTSLNDFYVTYEINAYSDQPNLMANTYADLHQNIQDKFNEAGVEIMSPHYAQIRDGNKTTIPDQYLPKHYQAPGLRIWPLSPLANPEPPPSAKGGGSP